MDECIQRLNDAGVRYLLIGGQAMRLEGMPRFSMDWDFFIPARDTENFGRLNAALAEWLDFPAEPLGPHGEGFVQTYQTPHGVIQFHLAPPGLPPFDDAERRMVLHHTPRGSPVHCVSAVDLLASKQATNRAKDAEDIEFLTIKIKGLSRNNCAIWHRRQAINFKE